MINEYNDMKCPQDYIRSRNITNTEKSILFGLRSPSIRSIRMNFPNMYSENTLCPICERIQDTQVNLPLCTVLTSILPSKKHMDYSLQLSSSRNMFRPTNATWSCGTSWSTPARAPAYQGFILVLCVLRQPTLVKPKEAAQLQEGDKSLFSICVLGINLPYLIALLQYRMLRIENNR